MGQRIIHNFQLPDLLAAGVGTPNGHAGGGDFRDLKIQPPILPVIYIPGFLIDKKVAGKQNHVLFVDDHFANQTLLTAWRFINVIKEPEIVVGVGEGKIGQAVQGFTGFLAESLPRVQPGIAENFFLGDEAVPQRFVQWHTLTVNINGHAGYVKIVDQFLTEIAAQLVAGIFNVISIVVEADRKTQMPHGSGFRRCLGRAYGGRGKGFLICAAGTQQ